MQDPDNLSSTFDLRGNPSRSQSTIPPAIFAIVLNPFPERKTTASLLLRPTVSANMRYLSCGNSENASFSLLIGINNVSGTSKFLKLFKYTSLTSTITAPLPHNSNASTGVTLNIPQLRKP